MAEIRKILEFGSPLLRQECDDVTVFDRALADEIDSAAASLADHGSGAAIAAPQIGIMKKFTVINYMGQYFELINPVITSAEGEITDDEGCLSMPGFSGQVPRAAKITADFQDREGNHHTASVEGRMARCFQHETDHLHGILYIDRMKEKFISSKMTGAAVPVKLLADYTNGKEVTEEDLERELSADR